MKSTAVSNSIYLMCMYMLILLFLCKQKNSSSKTTIKFSLNKINTHTCVFCSTHSLLSCRALFWFIVFVENEKIKTKWKNFFVLLNVTVTLFKKNPVYTLCVMLTILFLFALSRETCSYSVVYCFCNTPVVEK